VVVGGGGFVVYWAGNLVEHESDELWAMTMIRCYSFYPIQRGVNLTLAHNHNGVEIFSRFYQNLTKMTKLIYKCCFRVLSHYYHQTFIFY
jgi:hypothetical protein